MAKSLTEEHKKKISLAHMGKPKPKHTPEHNRKIGLAGIGRKHSVETRLKMSKSMTGLRHPNIQGSKHPNWKGGVSKLGMHIRKSFKYRQWRCDVFARDDYTCLFCYRRGIQLEADHHPKTFAQLILSNNLKHIEEALLCEELWDINNGRTLCAKCHRGTPTYGNNKLKN